MSFTMSSSQLFNKVTEATTFLVSSQFYSGDNLTIPLINWLLSLATRTLCTLQGTINLFTSFNSTHQTQCATYANILIQGSPTHPLCVMRHLFPLQCSFVPSPTVSSLSSSSYSHLTFFSFFFHPHSSSPTKHLPV